MSNDESQKPNMALFWGCFIALIATAFSFVSRGLVLDEWGKLFNLTESQKQQINGVGLWPFAVSIVLFSLVIDKIGYKIAMFFSLSCHIISTIILCTATGYTQLYVGTLILALGNGTVEAFINPVVATIFNKDKTKWLNILHAGWPGGLVFGGLIIVLLPATTAWQIKIGLILIPTVLYALMLVTKQFPINERVSAGVSYKDMLGEVGALGAFFIFALVGREISRVLNFPGSDKLFLQCLDVPSLIIGGAAGLAFFAYTKSLGKPLFILLMLIMVPLATTELGTDGAISGLMEAGMKEISPNLGGGHLLIYTSLIMMVLRFFAGSIVHKISPLGLLAVSAVIAAAGLVFLSKATGITILAAATLYGFGKTFFWPTTLGVVAEQFPKGGAMTLNGISAVGMLGVGILGSQFIGYILDTNVDRDLKAEKPAIHQLVTGAPQKTMFGEAPTIDQAKLKALPQAQQDEFAVLDGHTKKASLATIALLPALMLAAYLMLIFYFKAKGGYKPVELGAGGAH